MDKKDVLKIISDFRKALETKIHVDSIILYGSYARGANREESDIDIVVISDGFKGKTHWQRAGMLADAIYQVLKPIEAVAMTNEEWEKGESVIAEFAKNGEIIRAA